MKELLPYLILSFACLAGFIIQVKAFKKEKAEIEKSHAEEMDKIKKETERKIREECLKEFSKEPLEIKHTLIHTNEYANTIIVDYDDINIIRLEKKELMENLRSDFADRFAREVIKPNINIQEIVDMDLHNKKKYVARIWIGF